MKILSCHVLMILLDHVTPTKGGVKVLGVQCQIGQTRWNSDTFSCSTACQLQREAEKPNRSQPFYGATAVRKLLSMQARASPRAFNSEIHALSSSFIQNLSKSMTRSVEVSRALKRRRNANACSSALTALLSKCASLASFTEV